MAQRARTLALVGFALMAPAITGLRGAPQQKPAPPVFTPAQAEERRRAQFARLADDFAQLERYRADNAALGPGANRVVFFGDSITEGWVKAVPAFFAGRPYVDRGISGQTTPQMLVRFRQDVVALRPKVVVILAGTNDISGKTGPATPAMIEDNLASMVDIARTNDIGVVLASILPTLHYFWAPAVQPAPAITAVNAWMKRYAASRGLVYLDYYSAMVDDRQALKAALTDDGVHPNATGYAVMAPLADSAIARAIEQGARPDRGLPPGRHDSGR